jgi:tRNA threonylcarbamoyladenosine biosynthesis protein TsaB
VTAPHYLLALETSGEVCGVALTRDGVLIAERRFRHEMHLSERIMGEFDGLLTSSGIALENVSTCAVGIGPGSFTGTRIGVMTMKTLASVTGKPIYGIDSLAALAAHYSGLQNVAVVPILPCRSGTVFAAIYDTSDALPHAFHPPSVLTMGEIAELLEEGQPNAVLFCGSAIKLYQEALQEAVPQFLPSFGIADEPTPAQIARLADLRRLSEPADDVLALAPLYLAPPPITQSKIPIPTAQTQQPNSPTTH